MCLDITEHLQTERCQFYQNKCFQDTCYQAGIFTDAGSILTSSDLISRFRFDIFLTSYVLMSIFLTQ